jgi:hypothetical protein
VLTPEEWVRQNFILFLSEILGYPIALIAVERQITLSDLKKRFDIVVYDQRINPVILIECKEMNTPMDQKVLDQILAYQSLVQAQYLVITNGNQTHAFGRVDGVWQEMDSIKGYGQ